MVSDDTTTATTSPSPIRIDIDNESVKTQGDLFGIFFEDLNHAADGGLYAELVRNRSFEFDPIDNDSYTGLTAWRKIQRSDALVRLHVDDAHPLNDRNRHYAVLDITATGDGAGLCNLGYADGIPVSDGQTYRFSCWVRLDAIYPHPTHATEHDADRHVASRGNENERHTGTSGGNDPRAIIQLSDADGTEIYGETILHIPATARAEWTQIHGTVTARVKPCDSTNEGNGMQNDAQDSPAARTRRTNGERTDPSGQLALTFDTPCRISIDMVSLFPERTFHDRPNGMRRDIAQLIADMKPKFMRFPGGCMMHIGSLDNDARNGIYRWKNTLGPLETRPSRRNSWNYNNTFGLGYFEFFQFCEDIGTEPMPVIAGGWDPHNLEAAPLDDMDEWVSEALDLIEFANGPADSRWGSVRAEMGHPGSFHLKYLGIGNEETGNEFYERYDIMAKAIRERHPDIQIIGSAGPTIGGPDAERHWADAAKTGTAFMDEHYYQCPEWYIANVDRYASYRSDEGWPRAFLGEYASCGKTWRNALAEAAFLTGVEKAPGIALACYAPMLCNTAYSNWEPNMIYFDGTTVYGTPSYWVQRMFMTGQGTHLLATHDNMPQVEPSAPSLRGLMRLTTTNAQVDIMDFTVRDADGTVVSSMKDRSISPDHASLDCGNATMESYEVEFSFVRRNGELSGDLNGKYAFGLDFAMRDDDNRLRFGISGWQRQSGLSGCINGGLCSMQLTQHIIERNVTYRCRLSVDGPQVRGWIDDELMFDYTLKEPTPRPLYYSAVRDEESGETIIKIVNITDTPQPVRVRLAQTSEDTPAAGTTAAQPDGREAVIESIENTPLDATNDFAYPERVTPHRRIAAFDGDELKITAAEHSFLMIRIAR